MNCECVRGTGQGNLHPVPDVALSGVLLAPYHPDLSAMSSRPNERSRGVGGGAVRRSRSGAVVDFEIIRGEVGDPLALQASLDYTTLALLRRQGGLPANRDYLC